MKKKEVLKRIAEGLLILINIIYVVFFGYVFIRIVFNTNRIIPASLLKYCSILLLWCIMLVLGGLIAKCVLKQRDYKWLFIVIFLMLQGIYVWAVYSQVDSDAYVINYIAYHFACGNYAELEGFWRQYLSVYTNNVPATAFLVAIYKIWIPNTLEQSWLILSFLAAALSDVALMFIYKLIKVILDETAATMALIFAIPMISLSEPSTILYSDIIVLWTTPVALYAIAQSIKKKNALYMGVAGGMLAFGGWIKAQSIVVVIAVCIVIFLVSLREMQYGKYKMTVWSIVLFVGLFGVMFMGFSGVSNKGFNLLGEEYVEKNKMPAIHWVAMGLNPESNGAYSLQDVNEMIATEGQAKKEAICCDKIVSRLDEMGLDGLASHLDEKIIYGMGYGTFTSGREWRGILLNDSLQAKRIQNWTIVHNPMFDNFTAVWIQMGYILLFFFSVHSAKYMLVRMKKESDKCLLCVTNICRIAMIGIGLMLCMLERNLRYMYAMVPCMIILSIYDLKKISDDWKTIIDNYVCKK